MVFADRFGNPCPRGSGIHHGFEGRESLARDQAKRGFWVQPASHQLKIMAINVGDKVHPWSRSGLARNASTAIRGPKSDPPIPMLMTSVNGTPLEP